MFTGSLSRFSAFGAAVALAGGVTWQAWRGQAIASSSPGVNQKAIAEAKVRNELRVIAEGRVVTYPGAEVVVGSEVAGRIIALPVEEKMQVKRGDLIAELNSADHRAAREEAIARIEEAEADIHFFELELRREETLLARHAGTSHQRDSNRRALQVARAKRLAAIASRDREDALIAKAHILAPIDGVVTARHAHPGETIKESDRLVTIADLTRARIEAEVDEFDTDHIVLNALVTISAEGYPSVQWSGKIEEIPDTVVGRRLRPEDPGRPIDSRVLPVKIAIQGTTPLKLGQRVEVEIRRGKTGR